MRSDILPRREQKNSKNKTCGYDGCVKRDNWWGKLCRYFIGSRNKCVDFSNYILQASKKWKNIGCSVCCINGWLLY